MKRYYLLNDDYSILDQVDTDSRESARLYFNSNGWSVQHTADILTEKEIINEMQLQWIS